MSRSMPRNWSAHSILVTMPSQLTSTLVSLTYLKEHKNNIALKFNCSFNNSNQRTCSTCGAALKPGLAPAPAQ
jgi:hypothetical protein